MLFKNTFLSLLTLSVISSVSLPALIIETYNIEDVAPYVDQKSFVLFNIAEVITDSTISLGSSPWRKYIKNRTRDHGIDLQNRIHDTLTLLVAEKVKHKPVQTATPILIQLLQERGIAVAALTARGRSEWYTTPVPGVDDLTEKMLKEMGVDFSKSKIPFIYLDSNNFQDHDSYRDYDNLWNHYRNGIFYANHMEKGPFLFQLLENSGYRPLTLILIDDKIDSLRNVEDSMNELGIPFIGFLYKRTAADHHDFSPMVAHIQLQQLFDLQEPMSDEQAIALIKESYSDVDPDLFFLGLLGQLGLD